MILIFWLLSTKIKWKLWTAPAKSDLQMLKAEKNTERWPRSAWITKKFKFQASLGWRNIIFTVVQRHEAIFILMRDPNYRYHIKNKSTTAGQMREYALHHDGVLIILLVIVPFVGRSRRRAECEWADWGDEVFNKGFPKSLSRKVAGGYGWSWSGSELAYFDQRGFGVLEWNRHSSFSSVDF